MRKSTHSSTPKTLARPVAVVTSMARTKTRSGDEAVWTDINGTMTVRRDNVTVQFTLPKGKETQVELAKAVVQGF